MLCLSAAGLITALALDQFTLTWTHSIERIRWEEDWRVEGDNLRLLEARIRGSGAGMEIPPGASFERGLWRYAPTLPPQPELQLAHSPYAGGYELCAGPTCTALAGLLPGLDNHATLLLKPCLP